MLRRTWCLLGAVAAGGALGVACAARGPSPALTADLGRAEAFVRDGCYACLLDALAVYEPYLAVERPEADVVDGAIDVLVLITLREKELGLPFGEHLERVRALAPRAEPPAVGRLGAADLVELAALVPEEPTGYDPDRVHPAFGEWRTEVSALRSALGPVDSLRLVETYVGLSIDCADRLRRDAIDADAIRARFGGVPLIEYRLATCSSPPAAAIGALGAVPRWPEAEWFEGQRALSVAQDVVRAREHFARAVSGVPGSPAFLLSLARAEQALEELEPALAHYDELLQIEPRHRSGRLGRVITLTYLERHEEAVADATRLIELGTYLVADAYYWRAWNNYHLGELGPAWTDVEEAAKGQSGSHVHTLAGLIAYARHELDTAKDRFTTAHLDPTNCDAPWYLGLVHVDQASWDEAAVAFGDATACFQGRAVTESDALARLAASERAPAVQAREAAERKTRIAEAEKRTAQSAYNAAAAHARLGNRDEAIRFADIAAADAAMREKALALKARLEAAPEGG